MLIINKNKTTSKVTIIMAIILFFISGNLYAQDKERVEVTKYFVKAYFRLPIVTSNKFYKDVSRGISDVGLSLNYEVYKGFNLGLGLKHSFFEISQFKISENLDAQTYFYGPFTEISYIKYLRPNIFADFNFQIGIYEMLTSSNPCRNSGYGDHKSRAAYFSPNLSFFLKTPDRIAYSFSVGYTITQSSFSPQTVCLENLADSSPADYIGNISHFNVGFGVLVYIGKLNTNFLEE